MLPSQRLEYAKALEDKIRLRESLPHLYRFKKYKWAREFMESFERINLLCAANQISKSTTQICKCIEWATNPKLWPALWGTQPNQFWYLYPSAKQAKIEFETKWVGLLPAKEFRNHPQRGWKLEKQNGEIFAIHFNSGVHVYFKNYTQDAKHLQSGTVFALFCDEELPMEHYEELMQRLSATDGYFNMVFTATLGQDFWASVMEPQSPEDEKLKHARKWTVSMYDCQQYEDGTKSFWTDERIARITANCGSQEEVLRRVYGRFIRDAKGRKYPTFDIYKHLKQRHPLPANWVIYSGVDIGSGGKTNHPGAIVFVGVDPHMRQGRVFLAWRGDGFATTATDIYLKHEELKKDHKIQPVMQVYDFASKDFKIISERAGQPFIAANKGHERGEQILNALFKNDMLMLYDDPEIRKLATELVSLSKSTPKTSAKDDLADALRYTVSAIPWDWSLISGELPEGLETPEKPLTDVERQLIERKARFKEPVDEDMVESMEDQFRDLNEAAGEY